MTRKTKSVRVVRADGPVCPRDHLTPGKREELEREDQREPRLPRYWSKFGHKNGD